MQTPILAPERSRMILLDAARGIALFGVMLGNGMEQLSSNLEHAVSAGLPAQADTFFTYFWRWFTFGKARTLFMLLFGIGFALQLERITRQGGDSAAIFRRRMTLLLGIGLLHQFLFSMVDIIHFYALAGFALLLFRDWRPEWLFRVGLVLGACGFQIGRIVTAPFSSETTASAANAIWLSERALRAELLPNAGYLEFLQLNAAHYFSFVLSPAMLGFMLQLFGVFLLGMWIARRGFLQDLARWRPVMKFWWSRLLLFGLAMYGLLAVLRPYLRGMADFGWYFFGAFSVSLWLVVAAAYALIICLLIDRPRLQLAWRAIAAVGRMPLSNYVMQSLVFLVVLYGPGLGLLPAFGPAWMFVLVSTTFAMQIALSGWWLNRFRFGPLEWLWRSATYRTWLPLRHEVQHVQAASA